MKEINYIGKTVDEINEKVVAIVSFGIPDTKAIRPGMFYQVTIDPEFITRGGFIRFGNTRGDEIIGWNVAKNIYVAEIIGEWKEAEEPEFNFKESANG